MKNLQRRLNILERSAYFQRPEKELWEKYGLHSQHEFDEVATAFIDSFEAVYGIDFHDQVKTESIPTIEKEALWGTVLEQFKAGTLLEDHGRYRLNQEFTKLTINEKE